MNKQELLKIIKIRSNTSWWIDAEREVINRYGQLFHPQNLEQITKEDFKSFLLIKNNLHWDGIHRQSNLITADMDKFKNSLQMLLNESISLNTRLDQLFDKNSEYFIKGLGKAVITPILLVVYPNKYGVWNTKSEAGLKSLELLPNFTSKDTFTTKYLKINEVLNNLADELNISLWNLDGLLGEIMGTSPITDDPININTAETEADLQEYGISSDNLSFAIEKHLEEFIIANWEKTIFGQGYDLIYEEGDLKSQQYPTATGAIDILAISQDKKTYLVIELKKGRSSDAVVGQILRYIHWVEDHLCQENKQQVKGAVVVLEPDQKLKYSIKGLKNIDLYTYQLKFQLNKEIIK